MIEQRAKARGISISASAMREYVDEARREDIAIWAVVDPELICDRSKR
ncbi:MAG TPA: hypothetical protein VN417_02350 [Candidatus Cryosericum sp.]|nr:hypothetical protein [Candidatus Cryosericum sp.]